MKINSLSKRTLDGIQLEFYDQLTRELKQNSMDYNNLYNQYKFDSFKDL